MLANLLNKLFDYDYIKDSDGLIARVYYDNNVHIPFYYNTDGLMVDILQEADVEWLTCESAKYFPQEL
jgi:hypothetical protein